MSSVIRKYKSLHKELDRAKTRHQSCIEAINGAVISRQQYRSMRNFAYNNCYRINIPVDVDVIKRYDTEIAQRTELISKSLYAAKLYSDKIHEIKNKLSNLC